MRSFKERLICFRKDALDLSAFLAEDTGYASLSQEFIGQFAWYEGSKEKAYLKQFRELLAEDGPIETVLRDAVAATTLAPVAPSGESIGRRSNDFNVCTTRPAHRPPHRKRSTNCWSRRRA